MHQNKFYNHYNTLLKPTNKYEWKRREVRNDTDKKSNNWPDSKVRVSLVAGMVEENVYGSGIGLPRGEDCIDVSLQCRAMVVGGNLLRSVFRY